MAIVKMVSLGTGIKYLIVNFSCLIQTLDTKDMDICTNRHIHFFIICLIYTDTACVFA